MVKTLKLFFNLIFLDRFKSNSKTMRYNPPIENDSEYVIESVDAILETAKKVYDEEIMRFNQIESKTNIAMAFSGVLLGVIITFYSSTGIGKLENIYLNVGFGIFKLLNIYFILRAIYFLNQSMKSNTYSQFPLDTVIDFKYFKEREDVLKIELAATYNRVIKENQELLIKKVIQYDDGNRSTSYGFFVFIFIFILEMIVKSFF